MAEDRVWQVQTGRNSYQFPDTDEGKELALIQYQEAAADKRNAVQLIDPDTMEKRAVNIRSLMKCWEKVR